MTILTHRYATVDAMGATWGKALVALVKDIGLPIEIICLVGDQVRAICALDYEEGPQAPLVERATFFDLPDRLRTGIQDSYAVHPDGCTISTFADATDDNLQG